jgi:hypothetical protein
MINNTITIPGYPHKVTAFGGVAEAREARNIAMAEDNLDGAMVSWYKPAKVYVVWCVGKTEYYL